MGEGEILGLIYKTFIGLERISRHWDLNEEEKFTAKGISACGCNKSARELDIFFLIVACLAQGAGSISCVDFLNENSNCLIIIVCYTARLLGEISAELSGSMLLTL